MEIRKTVLETTQPNREIRPEMFETDYWTDISESKTWKYEKFVVVVVVRLYRLCGSVRVKNAHSHVLMNGIYAELHNFIGY